MELFTKKSVVAAPVVVEIDAASLFFLLPCSTRASRFFRLHVRATDTRQEGSAVPSEQLRRRRGARRAAKKKKKKERNGK